MTMAETWTGAGSGPAGSGPAGTAPAGTAPPPTEVPLEHLEAEICTLAGHLDAATCRWLQMVADFERREGWAGWGVMSCAHWLMWRCGLSLVVAREKCRVARALEHLP
ncbi:MAG: HNH endonuclease, partial [Acidimicrobiales bacterium]